MNNPNVDDVRGWGFPGRANKAHFFVGMTSLCGRWGFYRGPLEPDEGTSKDDCVKCRRALDGTEAT